MATVAASPSPTLQALLGALADRPDSTAAEVAAAAGMGRSTASKLLATLAAQRRVLRRLGGHQDGRRAPDRWTLITTATTHHPKTTPAANLDRFGQVAGRLGAGQLRDLVEACLAQRPGQPLSPTAIAKTLDRSAGAVANALQVLASQGRVVQTHTTPRRYVIAETTAASGGTN